MKEESFEGTEIATEDHNRPVQPASKSNGRSSRPVGSAGVRLNSFQWITIIMALVVTGVVSFMGGIVYNRQTGEAYSDDFQDFWEAWSYIDKEFYGDMPSRQDRVYGAIQGAVATLNDPYSAFSPPEEADAHRQFISGKFGGIGATLSLNENGEPYIVHLLRGNPAEKAGLEPLDVIRAIDGQIVQGLTLEEVVDRVKGDVGAVVTLTLYRPAEDRTFDKAIRRAVIEELTAYSEIIDGVGYLRLSSFNGVAAGQTRRELERLLDQKPRAIVFDLRGNGGGLLDEAVEIADLFLDQGLILTERSRKGEQERYYAESGDSGERIPLVVLVDGKTASASEVVVGALQDRDRAILVGQRTYGKGSVQLVHDLPGGGQLRLTVAAWFTPNGTRLHLDGLEPDVPVDGDQFDPQGNDRFLDAALDYINQHFPAQPTEQTAEVGTSPAVSVNGIFGG